jgi:hypothetical protein
MTPKEAEKKYGKEMARLIWESFDLINIKVSDTLNGLDIPDYEWENIFEILKTKDL